MVKHAGCQPLSPHRSLLQDKTYMKNLIMTDIFLLPFSIHLLHHHSNHLIHKKGSNKGDLFFIHCT
jgi:hypothetical protein